MTQSPIRSPEAGAFSIQAIQSHVCLALEQAASYDNPYRHWLIDALLPAELLTTLQSLEFPAPTLDGVSGKRELHNDQRSYFDQHNINTNDAVALTAHAFQGAEMVGFLARFFDTDLNNTFLRIEYAVDTKGFWLQPHTDLGVKRLTILHYISDEDGQDNLGTDVYNTDKQPVKRTPFQPNTAFALVPSDNTYHGFEPREIIGTRKSLIINYVTDEWRDRDQLCFPQDAVCA